MTLQSKAKPYGLLGLCLSLLALSALALLYASLAGLIVDGCVKGWAHLSVVLTSFGNKLVAGDGSSFIALMAKELGTGSPHSGLAISLIIYTALGLAVLTLARFRGGRHWRDLIGWQPWAIWKASRAFWLIAAAGIACGLAADIAVAYLYPPSKDWFTVPKADFESAAMLFILAALFAPVAEELVFRGWIYTSLRAKPGFWAALIISAATFAGLHYEDTHIYAIAVFPIGLVLGALREKEGSLKASISFHAFYNALAFGLAALDLA